MLLGFSDGFAVRDQRLDPLGDLSRQNAPETVLERQAHALLLVLVLINVLDHESRRAFSGTLNVVYGNAFYRTAGFPQVPGKLHRSHFPDRGLELRARPAGETFKI